MGSLKEVRNRIASVKNTQQITRAMKVVSAAKLRKAQMRIVQMRPYAAKLRDMLSNLSSSLEGSEAAKLYAERPVNKVLVIVVTSDRGLAGSFNSVAIKETIKNIQTNYASQYAAGNVHLLTVGKRGRDYFSRRSYHIAEEHNTLFNNLTYEASAEIMSKVVDRYIKGEYDAVDIIYNQFRNAAVYVPTRERLLPVPPAADEAANAKGFEVDYIFEPSKEAIVDRLVDQSLKIGFFRALLESNAAEHGSRMTAMDKATDNAEELLYGLKLRYNKERQASITKELLEIVGGAQALNA